MAQKRAEYAEDVDIFKLASELVVDGIVHGDDLRAELIRRFDLYREGYQYSTERKHGVVPV